MESDAHALKTGIFLLAASALLVASVMLFADRRTATRPYLVYSNESVGGLAEESRVYYKGVEVGRVTSIGFEGDDFDRVRILIRVDERIPLGTNTYAELELRGITGEYDLTLDNDGELGAPLKRGAGEPPVIPMRRLYIVRLGESVERALDEFRSVAANLRELTSEDNRQRVSGLLERWSEASAGVQRLAERLGETLETAPESLEQLPAAIESFSRAMAEVQEAAGALARRTGGLDELIGSMNEATGSLDQLLLALEGRTLSDVEETLRSLRVTLHQLRDLADSLARDPQSLLLGPPLPRAGPGERQPGR